MMTKRKSEKNITIVPDMAHVFPLPARVVPEPWEDLASLLSRTASQMEYKQVGWLLQPEDCAYKTLGPNVCFLREEIAYQYLEHLLQLNEETLYNLTFHRFLLQVQTPGEVQPSPTGYLQRPLLLSKHYVGHLFLSAVTTRVCPKCLAEEPACGRLYWNIGPIVACLRHHVFLVDRCPHCQHEIPLLRSVLTRCPHCRAGDYRLAPVIDLPEEPLFLSSQALILAHLGIKEEYRGDAPTVYGESPLHGLLPWQYFQLLESFRNVLDPFFPRHPFLRAVAGPPIPSARRASVNHKLSLGEWTSFVLTFHSLFTAWPDNFTDLLELLPSVSSHVSEFNGLFSHYGNLYVNYLYKRLRDPAFDFLREAFEDHSRKGFGHGAGRIPHFLRSFRGMDRKAGTMQSSYITRKQATKQLGVRQEHLSALIAKGTLRALKKPIGMNGKRSLWLIEKAEVEALLEEWKNLFSLEDVAQKYLGISRQQVLALTRAELLLPSRGPNIDRSLTWYYTERELERLMSELLSHAARDVPLEAECVPLSAIASISGLSLVEALKEILGGRLGLIDTAREIALFQRLVLSNREVKRFLKERSGAICSDLNLLSSRDVVKSLDIGQVTLKELVRQGVLVGKRQTVNGKTSGLFFQKEAVDSFSRSYVPAKKAAELLNVSSTTIYRYVYRGILHPVGLSKSLFFPCKEVEDLIPPDMLSIPKAAPLLEMSETALYARVKAGHIPHIRLAQWPEKRWLLSSDVERFREKEKSDKSFERNK